LHLMDGNDLVLNFIWNFKVVSGSKSDSSHNSKWIVFERLWSNRFDLSIF
jgi:hypothetical protein